MRLWKDTQKKIEKILLKPRSNKTLKKFIIITFSVIIIFNTYLLSVPYLSKAIPYKKGDISEEFIRVTNDINYELVEETQKKRDEAREHSPYIFIRDYNIYKKVVETVNREFSDLMSIKDNHLQYEKAIEILPMLGNSKTISQSDIQEILSYRNKPDFLIHWVNEYATLIFDNFGILDQPVSDPMSEELLEKKGIRIVTKSSGKESEFNWTPDRLIYYDNLFTYKNFIRLSNFGDSDLSLKIPYSVRKIATLRILQLYYKNPYTHFNSYETNKRIEESINKVKPVLATLKKGLTIVRPGDPIDAEKLMQIKLINEHKNTTSLQNIIGTFLIQAILALTIAFYIYQFSEVSMRNMASYIILLSLIYEMIFSSFIISRIALVQNSNIHFALFVPMIFMSVISCVLLGAGITFAAGIYLTLFIFFNSEFETASLIISTVSVLIGIFATLRMTKRSDFFNAALISGVILAITVLGIDLGTSRVEGNMNLSILFAFMNAFLSIVMAIGVLPIYEGLFNIPTRFRLMELSDINNPLLKLLSTEAPSSYSHSLLMASMAEKAVAMINGDTLLTRVGCLYHDIGKTLNAGIYAENKNHDNFKKTDTGYEPAEYARIIISHVNDGIEMARESRLPEKIVSFIPEHHGTTLMQYFYHETLKKLKTSKEKIPDKKLFQYPGPKPQSKETAVVMIADSLEAASRSIEKPNRENYIRLIETIIKNKTEEGQLDECNLTMLDIKNIKESFLETMMSTFHLRPSYPSKNKTRQLEIKVEEISSKSAVKAKTKKIIPKKSALNKKNQLKSGLTPK